MVQIAFVSVTTVIFGIASLILISKARNKLSEGSIRKYMDNFAICLAFIVIFSLWQTVRSVLGKNIDFEGFTTYPEFIFIVFAYIAFIIASFRVSKISEEFGFKGEGKKIEKIINEKQSNQATQQKIESSMNKKILSKAKK